MKTRMLQNSLLLKNLAQLKMDSANRRIARMQTAQMPAQLKKVIQTSQIARKTTVRLRDEHLVGPESQSGTIRSQINVLNKALQGPLNQKQRESILIEIRKWEDQLPRAQKRVDAVRAKQ